MVVVVITVGVVFVIIVGVVFVIIVVLVHGYHSAGNLFCAANNE